MKIFNSTFSPKTAVFLVMLVLMVVFFFKIADIALMFFAAFVLACTLNPMVDKLEKHIPRIWAVTIVLLILLLLILGILIPLISVSAEQLINVVKQIPKMIAEFEKNETLSIFGLSLENFIDPNTIKSSIADFSSGLLEKSINVTKIFADSLTTILAVSIMLFYIMSDSTMLRNGYLDLFPPKFKKKAAEILDTISTKVGGFVLAQLISMVFVGVLTSIGLALIGHKHAILLGFLTGILDIIPVIGPAVAVGVGLYASIKGGFIYVLVVFAIYMIAQWIQNQLLRPVVFGKLMDMHPLMIIFAILIGAQFLGVWGVILAPAIASVFCVLFDELYIKTINKAVCDENVCELPKQTETDQEPHTGET